MQADGLRPTGDRVRETLFNWLQMSISGSRCLDLYAGSGALGLEAASRGAASVTLVESSAMVANQLRQTLCDLAAGNDVLVRHTSADDFLRTEPQPFDIVFVDPPFELDLYQDILTALSADCLNPHALVYVELPTSQKSLIDALPATLALEKEKRFGDVTVLLLRYTAA